MSVWSGYIARGIAYSAENFLIGAPGLFNHLQIFNPIGSDVRVRVRQVSTAVTFAVVAGVTRYDTPLTTLGVPVTFGIENQLGIAIPAKAEMRSEQPVAVLGTLFHQIVAPANTVGAYPPNGIEYGKSLLPGQGMNIYVAAGLLNIVNFQWAEIPI